ncbi:MAG: PadR family transcriptional regulator AphA [Oleiphilaceae bacterium]|jgi:PadR family transcriptional regulator AphA
MVLLETEAGSGYDLLKRFKQRLGFFWQASHQQIYQQLKVMHQEGLINCQQEPQQSKPDRKIYTITELGHDALLAWLHEACKPQKVNDSLLVKLYGGHLLDKTVLLEEVRQHRSHHQKGLVIMQEMARQYQHLESIERTKLAMPYLTLRRGILGEQAWQVWAQEVEDFLLQSK